VTIEAAVDATSSFEFTIEVPVMLRERAMQR